jgi:hypothetical protein
LESFKIHGSLILVEELYFTSLRLDELIEVLEVLNKKGAA